MANKQERVIKLRCWYGGTMIIVGSIQFMMGDTYIVNDELHIPPEHLMQFTGLKDKNGKEIYEGDIVRCGDYIADAGTMNEWEREVIFNDGCFIGVDGEVNEVIGNIYETPNLIKHGIAKMDGNHLILTNPKQKKLL